jgi:CDP-diacylglycerol--glycerol-3-phosphate 3-phosphatidyltransferase
MLATITSDLDKIAPRFEMQPEQITIIQSPAEFYATLKVGEFHPCISSIHT